jgi:hypothetical protein
MKSRIRHFAIGILTIGLAGSVGCNLDGLTIDIGPGSDLNEINLDADVLIPVAILGSSQYSLLAIDLGSLGFGPDKAPPVGAVQADDYIDVNFDGYPDLVVRFSSLATGIQKNDKSACLYGASVDGTAFTACDDVTVAGTGPTGGPKKGPKK